MKSRQKVPMETKGYFIDDKTNVFSNLLFQWKVRLTHIPRLRPNSKICSWVGRN